MSITLAKEISFEGTGLHSGAACSVELLPSDKGGLCFKTSNGIFPITDATVAEDQRLTGLKLPDGSTVKTAEHLLASIVGMGIDDIVIESIGGEIPILDGSASCFAEAIAAAGLKETAGSKYEASVFVPVAVDDAKRGRSVVALPSDKLKITYIIDYSGTPIGIQHISYDITPEVFLNTISQARTFCLTSELDYLKANGLARGGSLENAMVFDDRSILNPDGLRFPLECVTHKVIDLLGDLALLGTIPTAHYVAVCAGHEMHGKLVDKLKRLLAKIN
jgi:UDP-3-O-[3-hydroxymyristoyl] N-acetylglucosamine deacetylase